MAATKTAQGDVLYLKKVEFLGQPSKPSAASSKAAAPEQAPAPAQPEADQAPSKAPEEEQPPQASHHWNWPSDVLSADTFLAHLAKKSGGRSTLKAAKETFAILYELIYTSHTYPEFSWFQPDTSRLFPPGDEASARLLKKGNPQQGPTKLVRSFISSNDAAGPALPPIPISFVQTEGKVQDHRRCAYCLTREEALPPAREPKVPARLLVCSQCKKVAYCSKECQKLDWKEIHKGECKRE